MNLKYLFFAIAVIACQTLTIHAECGMITEINNSSGSINGDFITFVDGLHQRCWRITVPSYHQINISIEMPEFAHERKKNCEAANIQVTLSGGSSFRFCDFIKKEKELLSFFPVTDSYVDVMFYVNSRGYRYFKNHLEFKFTLNYFIEPSAFGEKRFNEARENAIKWLKRRHSPFWGWKEDTPRAVTALYLSGDASFNGALTEEIMAKEAELRTALALTWNTVSSQQLSRFINGLLTTCHKPRRFYGHDLVSKLKKQVESSSSAVHPTVYLALCNANETWPVKANSDLTSILSKKSEYLFVKDMKAFAVMALACAYNRTNFLNENNNRSLKSLYLKTIKQMKEDQFNDGSFGNVPTTAHVSQALIASGEMLAKDLRMNATFHYMMKELNDSKVDFLSVYATLPLLNGKTLADIAHIDCRNHPRRKGDDPASEIDNYQGPKIRVEYSLYIGDQKDVIHTISLLVPQNSTAYRVMGLAGKQDKKYEIKAKTISNKKYVYEIAGIQNNSEEGKFWLLYKQLKSSIGFPSQITSNPDELILDDGDHLIMWYKTLEI